MMDQAHWTEVERLWSAVKRDYFSVAEVFAGSDRLPEDEKDRRLRRLERNWNELCDLDLDVASGLHHGVNEVSMLLAGYDRPDGGPATRHDQRLKEALGVSKLGRDANPGADADTLGELYELGEEELRRAADEAAERLRDD